MTTLITREWTELPSQEIFENLRTSLREAERLGLMEVEEDIAALDELERRLSTKEEPVFVLPVAVTEAIRTQFGGGRQTFDAMTRRVRFAYSVWQGKYGPWSPEQADYAEELCVWAINQAAQGTSPGHSRARAYTLLDRIVHHENTHKGFQARQGELFDITAELKEML